MKGQGGRRKNSLVFVAINLKKVTVEWTRVVRAEVVDAGHILYIFRKQGQQSFLMDSTWESGQ